MTRKLDKEHLEQIQKLREQFSQITSTIGSITIEEIVLKRQLDKLQQEQERFLNQLDALQTQESELIEKMRERYGEGQINVCGEGGNIERGDLIVTSSIPGKGMKQADDIVRSYTVAKARESMTFSSSTEVKLVACEYFSG